MWCLHFKLTNKQTIKDKLKIITPPHGPIEDINGNNLLSLISMVYSPDVLPICGSFMLTHMYIYIILTHYIINIDTKYLHINKNK